MIADLSGSIFNMLTVLEFSHRRSSAYYWKCKCDCGNITITEASRLKSNKTKSCGCLIRSKNKVKNPSYRSWYCMKDRCLNPKNRGYADYGGRGIMVCDEWLSFEGFYKDMGERPSKFYSLERDNVSGNYELSNCRWATTFEQTRNKRNNVWLEFNGERNVLADWAKILGVAQNTIMRQINNGIPFSEVAERYMLKRQMRSTKRVSSRIVVDSQTGIFYDSILSASIAKCLPYSSLNHKLNNYNNRVNDTGLIFV